MAIYRTIHTSFWQDTKVLDDMDIEERYFWLYILTNPHSNQVGCFEISKRQMCNETGFDSSKISSLLEKFENELDLIIYSNKTKELFIRNWNKYNWTKSPKVKSCIKKEIEIIKSEELKREINDIFSKVYDSDNIYPIDTASIPYEYPIDSLSIDYAYKNNNNNNNNKNNNKKNNNNKNNNKNKKENTTTMCSSIKEKNAYGTHTFDFSFISSLGKEMGIDEEYCKKFFNYYDEVGWLTAKGEPIKNVKMLLRIWYNKDKMKNTKEVKNVDRGDSKNEARRIFGNF